CVVTGDRSTDIEMGKNAGCKTILVRTGDGTGSRNLNAGSDHVCENLLEAARLIIKIYKRK
ncbi:MAG: HAD hydrolase-like protein, partial [Candidatus Aenigmarchaeota archaeon]|nr:HAD hydrolase-like protein [Candidatus Aenigmarchaeota archaeon]